MDFSVKTIFVCVQFSLVDVAGNIGHNEHVYFSSNGRLACTFQSDTNRKTRKYIVLHM